MSALINSFLLVFISEMGDKTQLLSLLLITRYRKPWTILAGVFVATILNHAIAAGVGDWLSHLVSPDALRWILALLFFGFAAWILVPDKEGDFKETHHWGVFATTVVAFFLAEMGDKTQLATVGLGAKYSSIFWVTIGTTLGMLAANGLVIYFGETLLKKIPMHWVRRMASLLFVIFGLAILLSKT